MTSYLPGLVLIVFYIHELRFAGLHASDTVVVALSGGVDSMALCHLASQVIACNRPCCPRCIPPVLLQPVWKFSKLATFMHTRMLTNTNTPAAFRHCPRCHRRPWSPARVIRGS